MAFTNPIVAGEELVRSGIKSKDFADSSGAAPGAGWRIARDGSAVFNNLETRGNAQGSSASYDSISANTSLLYKGDELSELLSRGPKGIVAFGQYNGALANPTTTTEVAFLELDVPMVQGRQYKVCTSKCQVNGSTNAGIFLRNSTTATPTLTSPIVRYETNSVDGRFVQIIEPVYPATTGVYKYLLTFKTFTGGGSLSRGDVASPQMSMWVEDHGWAVENTGISNPLTVPVGSKSLRTFEVIGDNFRTYDTGGSYNRADYLWQGKVPGVASVRAGWCWFPLGSVGSASIADLSGVAPGDMVYLDAYAYYPHWYSSAGGTALIGHHNVSTITPIGATEVAGGIVEEVFVPYPARNVGKWFSLFGTGVGNALLAGTFKGLITGNHAGGTGTQFYGYASEVRIRAGYYK